MRVDPLRLPFDLSVRMPGSKSIANRALVAACLADGTTRIHGATLCDDVLLLAQNLIRMGYRLRVDDDVIEVQGGVPTAAGADTITNALQVLTRDDSVKSVLINIFGGITRGDLVAQGIIEALGRLDLPWPIVVRLDGTNAEEGRAILAASPNEKLLTAATMREAAERAVELAESN